jgi:hypothetical protein
MDAFATHRPEGQDAIVEASTPASLFALLGLFGEIV